MYRVLLYFLPLICSLSVPAVGQHYQHTALWLRLNANVDLSKRWLLTGDVYYRRQNDFHESSLNFLSRPYLNPCGRVGITYRTPHWAITAFPFVWFNSFPALGKDPDFERPMVQELRPSLYAEWSQNLSKSWSVRLRGGYEYRYFLNDPTTARIRFRAYLRYAFSPRLYGYVWQEVMTAAPPNADLNPQPIDINRVNLMIGRNFSKHYALEAGYQFTHRQRRTLIEFDEEHALTITGIMRF
jgi:hypothetical protein